jgi:precorrin-6B methylase 2
MSLLLAQYEQNWPRYLDTDKEHPGHEYISKFYTFEFEKYKNKQINFLEIGCASGGSLLLWSDYFPSATIYGVDSGQDARFKRCKSSTAGNNRIKLYEASGYNPDLVNALPNFDIIIDDGPHTKESHLQFLDLYVNKLNRSGVLIIEDVENISYGIEYSKKLTSDFQYATLDINTKKEYNSILFVARKI